jgi:hypothetical protein
MVRHPDMAGYIKKFNIECDSRNEFGLTRVDLLAKIMDPNVETAMPLSLS